jgi:hypothetical protein
MKLTDIENEAGVYDASRDSYSKQRIDDTRRPGITLRHLNTLKKMRAARQLENLARRDILDLLYGQPVEGAGPGL